ncbi:MAG: hypothetical protein M3281_04235 [Chloroflexota bacterium]|nr:hypothetical protein [Chloroflexota bacterium]
MRDSFEYTQRVRPATFFVLTFVLSWLVWAPLALSHLGVGPFRIAESTSQSLRLLGVLMSAVSALILTVRPAGRAGLRRLLVWRVGAGWWLAAVAVQPLLLVAAWLAAVRLGTRLCSRSSRVSAPAWPQPTPAGSSPIPSQWPYPYHPFGCGSSEARGFILRVTAAARGRWL